MPSLRVLPTRLRFAALLGFLHSEAAGGTILMLSAAVALVWANSPAGGLYRTLLHAPLLHETPLIWINDGLMAVFFLLVGLELRREITRGELASPARLAAPGLAALGGMVVPAAILVALNWGDPAALRGRGARRPPPRPRHRHRPHVHRLPRRDLRDLRGRPVERPGHPRPGAPAAGRSDHCCGHEALACASRPTRRAATLLLAVSTGTSNTGRSRERPGDGVSPGAWPVRRSPPERQLHNQSGGLRGPQEGWYRGTPGSRPFVERHRRRSSHDAHADRRD